MSATELVNELNKLCLSQPNFCKGCPFDQFRYDDGEEWRCFVVDAVESGNFEVKE